MRRDLRRKGRFVLANVLTMVILHGNDKQFWPKIPYLSLRDESVSEHRRLLFNTLAVVTVGQVLLGRLGRPRLLPRLLSLVIMPASLPPLIAFGQRLFGERTVGEGLYHLALVLGLPLGVAYWEDYVVSQEARQ